MKPHLVVAAPPTTETAREAIGTMTIILLVKLKNKDRPVGQLMEAGLLIMTEIEEGKTKNLLLEEIGEKEKGNAKEKEKREEREVEVGAVTTMMEVAGGDITMTIETNLALPLHLQMKVEGVTIQVGGGPVEIRMKMRAQNCSLEAGAERMLAKDLWVRVMIKIQ
jgi:hypothetical protein